MPDGTAVERFLAGAAHRPGNPLAVRNIKASVLAADALPEADAYARELELGMEVMASEDAREGPRAGEARPRLHRPLTPRGRAGPSGAASLCVRGWGLRPMAP